MTEHDVADETTDEVADDGAHADAEQVAAVGVDLYWRPGCGFCSSLRRGLDKAGIDRVEHDIWVDPDAAAVVRGVARGNETVPTVLVGDIALVNPSAQAVVATLREHAPHLLPTDAVSGDHADADGSSRGTFGRLFERVRGD